MIALCLCCLVCGLACAGLGIILTQQARLAHYLGMLTHSTPIESQFMVHMTDNLNAEVVLGSVTNVREGVAWLNSTYLSLRLQRNPLVYGLTLDDLAMDPGGESECGLRRHAMNGP